MPDDLKRLTDLLVARQLMIATAESCTAGLVAKLLTDRAGSSQWFERGFVTYSDAAKQEMLGVSKHALVEQGAVSETIVAEMVRGTLAHSNAEVALAISGIAGPDGGSAEKPVGTVCFGWGQAGSDSVSETLLFPGDRRAIREQAAAHAIAGMLAYLGAKSAD